MILLDLALPYRSGASWLVELKADPGTAHIPVVILSAHPTVLPEGRRRLAHAILGKPFQTVLAGRDPLGSLRLRVRDRRLRPVAAMVPIHARRHRAGQSGV